MGICRPCSLHLGVLNVWTWQSHQTWLREFQSLPVLPVSSPAVQLQASLPFIGSFLPLVSHPVVCPLTLSPSLSGRDTWQTVTPLSLPPPSSPPIPRPYISSSFTCIFGRLSLVRRGGFSRWAQTEGLFQLCLHRDLPFSQNWPAWMMCLWFNRCPHKVWISADMIHHIH